MVVRRESTLGFGRREPRILAAVELIRREACNGLTALDVVKSLQGSRRLTEIRFREAMGHSLLDEILSVRMEKVQFLLSMTETPIGAIAAMCGFRSEIALHKFFRRSTGQCMREWRNQNRKLR
jgi:LacI family transcriptional regulator